MNNLIPLFPRNMKVVDSEADLTLPPGVEVYFRYVSRQTENDEEIIYLELWKVLKRTPKGVWVGTSMSWKWSRKFILSDARKKFAYPTIREAKDGFIAKKNRQISIVSWQLERAKAALKLAEDNAPVVTEKLWFR